MSRKIGMAVAAIVTGLLFGVASAKLPAPSDEQKAKAAEAKARADEGAKLDAGLLGKSQDRAVDNFKRPKVVKTGAATGTAVRK